MREQFNPFLNFDFLLDDIPIVYLFNEKNQKKQKNLHSVPFSKQMYHCTNWSFFFKIVLFCELISSTT